MRGQELNTPNHASSTAERRRETERQEYGKQTKEILFLRLAGVKDWDADTASSVMQQDREISQLQAACQSSIHLPADSPPTKAKLQLGVRVRVCWGARGTPHKRAES
ncbi:unnamed protein product [Leuciscus chuanchicus]